MDLHLTINSVKTLSEKTERVILFHSGAGKDSIALLHMMSPFFMEIVCVFMYTVKDLQHINRYILWAERKYPNCKFVQTPHYAYYNNKKYGVNGTETIEYSEWNLAKISDKIQVDTGIEHSVYGFKKNDSLNRRLMLKRYDDFQNPQGTKLYPLTDWNNKQVLAYIKKNRLIDPIQYGLGKSQGTEVSNLPYLLWLRENEPNDLKKTIAEYPDCERILFEYDHSQKQQLHEE